MSTLAYTPSNFDFFNQSSFDDTTVKFSRLNGDNSSPKSVSRRQKKQELLIVDQSLKIQVDQLFSRKLSNLVKNISS